MRRAKLDGASLRETSLKGAQLNEASFRYTDLTEARLLHAEIHGAHFEGANLTKANLEEAKLRNARFDDKSMLVGANLRGADLSHAQLSGADLSYSNLERAVLVGTDLSNTRLTGSRIYGIAAWDLKLDDQAAFRRDLVITPEDQSPVIVDELEVAQFVYLLLNNKKIRSVINTITSKAVLILGRFYEERKQVLDALREELRKHDLVPIVFDFEPSGNRDLTETVQLLANMSNFVVADLTDAKSIPQELSHIIPFFPSIPIRPILAEGEPYSMYEHWEKYPSVLSVYYYKHKEHLLANIRSAILEPIEVWNKKKDKKEQAGKRAEEAEKKAQAEKEEKEKLLAWIKQQGLTPPEK
ncbi:MAG: pentapeptide repeat-containing protein [Saprospiraceae bacterium]|nr:pentapeptide repeat-containing protein [Saprospiraceae bacterium]